MKEPVEYNTEIGPHKGWVRHLFATEGREWSLLTIDDPFREPPFSYLSPKDDRKAQPWPSYHIEKFDGILTVAAAVLIITRVSIAYRQGIEQGKLVAKAEFREAIGL